ncbi:MAG: anti-sigma F factor [Firmicutes bacterium]|nr:anti-sigma F factor [Bacillota bacterium]
MENFMSLKIYSKPGNETFVRSVVAAFAAQLNPTMDQINDIKTAVSEAVTNCIIHAYAGEKPMADCPITVDVLLDGGTVHITVVDEGVGIADVEAARQPFFTTKEGEERTGMGFTIMDAFMDKLDILSGAGQAGTVVRMSKIINAQCSMHNAQ